MKRNIGKVDKSIRLVLAALGVVVFFVLEIQSIWAYLILASSATLVLTVIMNWCPMCALFGVNTCEVSPRKSRG